MSNIYYYPEKYGLESVGEIQFSEPCYDFDFGVLWRDNNGKYYYGRDSGCSCPSPFEDTGLNDLDGPLDRLAAIDFITQIQPHDWSREYEIERVASDKVDLINKLVST